MDPKQQAAWADGYMAGAGDARAESRNGSKPADMPLPPEVEAHYERWRGIGDTLSRLGIGEPPLDEGGLHPAFVEGMRDAIAASQQEGGLSALAIRELGLPAAVEAQHKAVEAMRYLDEWRTVVGESASMAKDRIQTLTEAARWLHRALAAIDDAIEVSLADDEAADTLLYEHAFDA